MKYKTFLIAFLHIVIFLGVCVPNPVFATQTHGEPEGLVVHQITHLVFIFSMATLVFWLRQRRLIVETGWRYIQYAALLFILWNIDAFTAHLLDEQVDILKIDKVGTWQLVINTETGYDKLAALYYLVKLDHLICVPAMMFLYFGLKRLIRDSAPTAPTSRQA